MLISCVSNSYSTKTLCFGSDSKQQRYQHGFPLYPPHFSRVRTDENWKSVQKWASHRLRVEAMEHTWRNGPAGRQQRTKHPDSIALGPASAASCPKVMACCCGRDNTLKEDRTRRGKPKGNFLLLDSFIF